MRISDILVEATLNPQEYTLELTNSWTDEGDRDVEYWEDDVDHDEYAILQNGKVIGNLEAENYFGHITGKLHNKDLPNLENYGRYDDPETALKNFLASRTGARWASNLEKYQK